MDKMDKKIEQGREYRSMVMEIRKDADTETDYKVSGYATTYNQPYRLYGYNDGQQNVEVWEQIDSKAFDNTDMADTIMQYDHEGRVFARVSNGTLSLDKDDEHGLLINADLGGTSIGRELYEEIKGGYTSKMSFGFTVKADKVEETSDYEDNTVKYLRTITEIGKLYDVSAVSLPANDYTEISARKALDGVIDAKLTERLEAEKRAKLKAEILAKLKGVNND